MKKILLIAGLLMALVSRSYGQNEENVWVFGAKAGLDFTTASPVPVTNNLFPGYEGCASICDATGQLLFYSNGYWVWDRDHHLMPLQTAGITGYTAPISTTVGYPPLMNWTGGSITQQAAICGMPAQAGKYYLFSLSTGGQLFYTLIDMSLNSGKGDIVPGKKGIYFDGGLAEKMTVVKGCNNIWLVVRSLSSNTYKAYEINDTGIVSTPVVSNVGLLPVSWYRSGVIKFSPDGKKMAASNSDLYHHNGGLELYDFNASTGTLANAVVLDSSSTWGYYYGACFSPDNTKLYASTSALQNGNTFYYGKVRQFDISLATIPAIIASNTTIYTDIVYHVDNLGDLKRGKNGKIYFGSGMPYMSFNPYMHVINFPNLAGASCGLAFNAIAMPAGQWSYRGLPNDIAIIPAPDTITSTKHLYACFKDSLVILADTGKHYHWQNGSTERHITTYTNGIHIVSFINANCKYEVDTYKIQFIKAPTISISGYSCPGAKQAKAWVKPAINDTTVFTYSWMDSYGTLLQQNVSQFGDTINNLDTGFYSVHIETTSGCDTAISITIHSLPVPNAEFTVDSIICKNTPVQFTKLSNAPLWKWYFGDGNYSNLPDPQYNYRTEGNYTASLVVTNIEGCTDTAEKVIQVKDFSIDLTADQILVKKGEMVRLQSTANEPYTVLTWEPSYMFSDQTMLYQNIVMDTTRTFTVVGSSLYGCIAKASVEVAVRPIVFMPNAFTPNGDGVNDRFRPVSTGYIFVRYFEIYNRFGQMVYSAYGKSALEGWDGTFHGTMCELGTYYYHINIETKQNGTIALKGDVILIH